MTREQYTPHIIVHFRNRKTSKIIYIVISINPEIKGRAKLPSFVKRVSLFENNAENNAIEHLQISYRAYAKISIQIPLNLKNRRSPMMTVPHNPQSESK